LISLISPSSSVLLYNYDFLPSIAIKILEIFKFGLIASYKIFLTGNALHIKLKNSLINKYK